MYIRCAVCQAATWVETLEPGVAQLSIRCHECDQEYSLLAAGELGTTSDEQYQRARQFAEYNAIDLPSAYSVMLGVMSLEEAKAARENRVRRSVDVATFSEVEPPEELPYDEGFHAAVVEGHLTVQQASDRGDRRALASRLVQRHGLSTELALRVADNRISLAEARNLRPAVEQVPVSSRPATRSHKMLLFGFAAVVVLAVGIESWRKLNTSTAPPAPVVSANPTAGGGPTAPADHQAVAHHPRAAAAEVQTDPLGRVLRVSGPDPATVLIAFCASEAMAERLEPVELARAVPALPGTRLGIVRDADQDGALLSIRINKDQKTRRWVAGNGRRPIAMQEPPPFPPNHPRTPVTLE